MPFDFPRRRQSLADRVADIDAVLSAAPVRIRYRPLTKVVWRALLLTVPEVQMLLAAPPPSFKPLDLVALRLVSRACRGDARATSMIFDMIEGRPGARSGDVRPRRRGAFKSPELAPAERARMIAELEATLRKASSG
jgi:hypothetical protein